jgi:hypothetical protein
VLNVVHTIDKTHKILIIIEESKVKIGLDLWHNKKKIKKNVKKLDMKVKY